MGILNLLRDLGVFGIVSTVIGLLVKYFFDKRFKFLEQELLIKSSEFKLGLEKNLEKHKSELSILHHKKEKLHEKRLEVLSELFKLLVILDRNMKEMTAMMKQVIEDLDKEENERIVKTGKSYNDFVIFFSDHEIFFNEKTCELIDNLIKVYFNSLWEYSYERNYKIRNTHDLKTVYENISIEIPKILKELKSDFRAMIIVD